MNKNKLMAVGAIGAALAFGISTTAAAKGKGKGEAAPAAPKEVGKTVGKEPDMSKPAQVFILMGQSNMVGMGRIAGGDGGLEHAIKVKKLYPYLVDDEGKWASRADVRYVRVMQGKKGSMMLFNNEPMNVATCKSIGPEFGLAHFVGDFIDAPVMILKSCIGNRSLGWDLLPPGSEPYDGEPGYRGTKENPKGNGEKVEGRWYAGLQYDADVEYSKTVLSDLNKYYPGAKSYEVAGFFFWQGEKDTGNATHAAHYEENLVRFIKSLRKDFNAPGAKFVLGTLGEAKKGCGGNEGKILEAHLAVDGDSGKHPEFKGNVKTVYTNPLSKGGSGNGHYGSNAETYMNVGEAMGQAMVELLKIK
ncbi:MAG: sialate O-acetylesterase [Planctomycetales bacterium]|nr:sialate O-acetylesterase [Planctomycetales bacterium]